MAIEKSVYPAVEGEEDQPEIAVEVNEVTTIENDDGSVDIVFGEEVLDSEEAPFDANLAEYLGEDVLARISEELVGYIEADEASRSDWEDTYAKGLDVIGFDYEERSEPWPDACGAYSNVLAEAVIRFQAETMSETFPAAGPVKTKILGEETRDRQEAANRVRTDMNYELTERMTEYRPEHERMLYNLALAGSAFKKVYFDPNLGRQTAIYIPAEDVIVPYGASHIETAERVTHVMRKTQNEVRKLQASGFYRAVDLGDPVAKRSKIEEKKAEEGGFSLNDDERYTLYEVHVEMYIEEADKNANEIGRPYVITLDASSGEVLAIRRNWEETDPLFKKNQYFVHYVYVPGFGFYGLGLIHIIGGYAKAGTSLIRQLVDAGTLANLPGGLKTRGLRTKNDDEPIAPGEFRDVDVPSGSIRDNIMTLPYKEPSQTLLALLQQITEEGRRLGAVSDMNVSDMSANAPVGTTLAILERTLKPMAAVQARVHYTMKQEFKLLKEIIAAYAPKEYTYTPDDAEPKARQADYAMVEVIPVSDPNNTTMAQRVVQYQTALQMSSTAPHIYDLPQLHRQMLEVIGVKNAEKIIPLHDDIPPVDPVSENMNALNGKPIKAVLYQDHTAHIAAHEAFLQDPQIAAYIGQNPAGQQIMAALRAHIGEHLAYNYYREMEVKVGVPLPPPDKAMPEDMEVRISRLVADAAGQLSREKQARAAQAQAAQQAQDPVFQMQQREQANKELETQRKIAKDKHDADMDKAELQLKKAEALIDAALEAARLDAQSDQADKRADLDAAKTLLTMAKGSLMQRTNKEGE